MSKFFTTALCIMMLTGTACAGEKKGPESQKDKVSYSIGLQIGDNMKKQGLEIDPEMLSRGFSDGFAGKKPALTEEEIKNVMTTFQNEMMAKQAEKMKAVADKNKQEGEKFLSENKAKKDVKTTKSGLQYKVITEGKGKSPKATDTVSVHYRGTLIDGTEFDSSYKRGEPVEFPVNGVIPGWTEALQLMKEGSKWQLFIPSELAYGDRGAGPQIGPNSTLIFEVELLKVQ